MYVRVNEIQQGAGMWKSHETVEELRCGDLPLSGPVSVSLKLTNAETRILVQGQAQGTVKVECARCGEDFDLPLSVDLEESFVAEESPEARVKEVDVNEILTYKEDRVNLDEMLRQNFLAAIPMQPLCREGKCKGMCDQCGTNLNLSSCDCKVDEIDPRWATLREIQSRDSKPSLN